MCLINHDTFMIYIVIEMIYQMKFEKQNFKNRNFLYYQIHLILPIWFINLYLIMLSNLRFSFNKLNLIKKYLINF